MTDSTRHDRQGARGISRREVLGAAATLGVASLVLTREGTPSIAGRLRGLLAAKSAPDDGSSRETTEAATGVVPTIALLDGSLPDDDLASARKTVAPLEATLLGPDLLWEWRGGIAQRLSPGVAAIAITRWDKAIVLSGLAREARLPVRQERIGHSVFRTEIG